MTAFPDVGKIPYEGPDSKNPLAFRHYNAAEVVEGKTMADHLRYAVCYWHTFRGTGSDPFGVGTMIRPWDDGSDSIENAQQRSGHLAPNLLEPDLVDARGGNMSAQTINGQKPERKENTLPELRHLEHVLDGV